MFDAGVCAVQPVLPVLRGAVGLPAVLQDAGQGEPGLQGLPSGKPTASRLSSVNLADFLARIDLADFLHEVLLDFLAYSFAHSVNNILLYPNITILPKAYVPAKTIHFPAITSVCVIAQYVNWHL